MNDRTCSSCGKTRPLADLIAAIGPGGSRRYVCRPILSPWCFRRSVKLFERIEPADDPRPAA